MIHVASLLHDDVIDNAGVSWRSSQFNLAHYAEHISCRSWDQGPWNGACGHCRMFLQEKTVSLNLACQCLQR